MNRGKYQIAISSLSVPIPTQFSSDNRRVYLILYSPAENKLLYSINFYPQRFVHGNLQDLIHSIIKSILYYKEIFIFTPGGPIFKDLLLNLASEKLLSHFNMHRIFTASIWSINEKFAPQTDFYKMFNLQSSVRQFLYRRRKSFLGGGWDEMSNQEKILLRTNQILEEILSNPALQLEDVHKHLELQLAFIKPNCRAFHYVKDNSRIKNDILLSFIFGLIVHPRYFVIEPYYFNFYKAFNFLGLVPYNSSVIYENKSSITVKRNIYKFIKSELFHELETNSKFNEIFFKSPKVSMNSLKSIKNIRDVKKEKEIIKILRRGVWLILKDWQLYEERTHNGAKLPSIPQ